MGMQPTEITVRTSHVYAIKLQLIQGMMKDKMASNRITHEVFQIDVELICNKQGRTMQYIPAT